jgi:folate-binding protein YgfZ
MQPLTLHAEHVALGGQFEALSETELVSDYGDPLAEYAALTSTAGLLDLSFRGRFCLTGADRVRLLNGQVTQDVKALTPFSGCRAAFCTAKGRLVAEAHIFALQEELLLDVEPGATTALLARLEHHIVADDVQGVDVAPFYNLLSLQGPAADAVVRSAGWFPELPDAPLKVVKATVPEWGEVYLVRRSRIGGAGLEVFVPTEFTAVAYTALFAAVRVAGGRAVGFKALEWARIEAGIPRFGVDMDETNLPPETGMERDAISYSKGCYTGQETIARLRTYGQVSKALRGLALPDSITTLPVRGDVLVHDGRDIGKITSAIHSPRLERNIALGYVRKECNAPGTELRVRRASGEEFAATVVETPFR